MYLYSWLANFEYGIDIQWWMFALVAGLAIAIAFLTVSFQRIRATLADPVRFPKAFGASLGPCVQQSRVV